MTPPQVRVSIISEVQANALLKNDQMNKREQSGEILNNTGTMEYHQVSIFIVVVIGVVVVVDIIPSESSGEDSVCFVLLLLLLLLLLLFVAFFLSLTMIVFLIYFHCFFWSGITFPLVAIAKIVDSKKVCACVCMCISKQSGETRLKVTLVFVLCFVNVQIQPKNYKLLY